MAGAQRGEFVLAIAGSGKFVEPMRDPHHVKNCIA